jgi:tRNA A-37 threonylcarbamoyl transferase component Bud32
MSGCPNCGSPNSEGIELCEVCARGPIEVKGIDRYTLEGILGRGASSVVYRATDARTGRAVAVKTLNPELVTRPGLRERLREEAAVLQQLSHPNIVGVVDYIESEDAVWLVTEAVEGASLRTLLIHAHQLEPEPALAIFAGMLAGLAHAHERGLVHGDLKPENVLVEASGTARLVDFGQAVRTGHATTGGTAAYMSPEAVRGDAIGPASDLYSVGAVLYETLTGRPPFLATSEEALLRLQLSEPAPPISVLPPAIGSLVAALLEKDSALRPQRADETLGAFEAAVRDAYGSEWRRRAGVAALVETTATRFPTLSTETPRAVPAPPGTQDRGSSDVWATPEESDNAASAGRAATAQGIAVLRWVMAIEVLWFLMFGSGGALLVWRFSQNASSDVSCFGSGASSLGANANCGPHHGLIVPIALLVVGFVAFIVTAVATSAWAVKRFGIGVLAYMRRQRYWQPGAPTATAGAPGSIPGGAGWPGGMPPGTPGSPSGPPPSMS